MTKREAVIKALAHEEVRPCPYYLDMTDDVLDRMITDTKDPKFFENSGSYLAEARNESFDDLPNDLFRDMFGVVWNKGAQDGDFGVVEGRSFEDADFGDYVFPEPDEKIIREKCELLQTQKDKFRMYIIGFSLFERAWSLYTMPDVLCDMITEPEFIDELFDKIVEYNLKVVDIVAEYDIDCVFFGDDWGMQKGLIMGLPLWKKFIFPRIKKEYAYVHGKGMYVAQHSCGDCRETFPYLVDAKLDIYNTFQPEIYDIEDFKATHGKHITVFGGISTQTLLPFASPDEVEKEARRILKIMSENGGYILAPTHAMPNDIPSENVLRLLHVMQNQ